jgi:hypothetical protein
VKSEHGTHPASEADPGQPEKAEALVTTEDARILALMLTEESWS